ncbi:MAG: bifunctional [glutamine synthetase] adenylyltransferase/[glutamine synthetase]-adenylyl-L-tyrosine phosphorylase [Trueperella sp.]|nr:bifunctional [glutamine synthetase] adenylyltransferase/[glutamine synthetase]-adenylyl-L-tyrosine phosphorylase [Trueperella sp.]
MRELSDTSLLREAGFWDPANAQRLLADPVLADVDKYWLIERLRQVADPDLGLLGYLRLLESAEKSGKPAQDALYITCQDPQAAARLFAILGFSRAATDYLVARPANVHILQTANMRPLATTVAVEKQLALQAVHADPAAPIPVSGMVPDSAVSALRAHYWYRIIQIAAADLTAASGPAVFAEVAGAITDVAAGIIEAGLAVGRATIPNSEKVGLAVVAMGKTGGRELNYISDVDLVYAVRALSAAGEAPLAETDVIAIGTQLASFLARAVSEPGPEPALWEIDANLRPEGKDGPLVRTLESHLAYYERWAQNWEFQALLKARPLAGDMELGEKYVQALAPLVWSAAGREEFVEGSQAMRRRVEGLVPAKDAGRQLKLGKGGLRDVEFTVQLLQLVHGRTDETLRVRSTLAAIAALSAGGYINRDAAEELGENYRFLRTMEHRIQLERFHRSQLVPEKEIELRRIARAMRDNLPDAAALEEKWRKVQRQVREAHLEIYYRPLLPATARISADAVTLQADAAQARLAAIGFRDPASAYRNMVALSVGMNRTAAIQRQILPAFIGWLAEGAEPDQGLAAFRDLSEAMGTTSWYMRLLRDSRYAARRLARLLSASRYVAGALPQLGEALTWLDDAELLQPRADLISELDALLARRTTGEEIAQAGRYLRRRELLRTAMADVLHEISPQGAREAISAAGDIAVTAALRAAFAQKEPLVRFLVVAVGRLGGAELGYASDADLIFVHQPLPGVPENAANEQAIQLARAVISYLSKPGPEPAFPADADLRPEGKNGPLSRTLSSYQEYYERWGQTWEQQAALRARYCAGDTELWGEFQAIIDPFRYPAAGLTPAQLREIRTIKARVESERIPRGVDPSRQLKLGRGGLADVEWAVQLLQLRYGAEYPQLQVTGTLPALSAAKAVGVINAGDADRLAEAWSMASLLRDANVLGTGRTQGVKIDVLPHEAQELAVIAPLLGVPAAQRHDLEENYLKLARRARATAEHIIYEE